MSATNLTPLDVLQRRKIRLQVKSDALINVLEENFSYLQENVVPLITDTAVNTFISKMPPFIQNFLRRDNNG